MRNDPKDLLNVNHHLPQVSAAYADGDRSPASGASPHRTPDAPSASAEIKQVDEFRVTPVVVLFEGRSHGIETSVYVTAFEPGEGPRLHRHPYPEVFLVEEGHARFHVDGAQHTVDAGHFVVVAAETPHRYENAGPGTLKVMSVHPNGVTIQTDL